jgi:hypothetical protein
MPETPQQSHYSDAPWRDGDEPAERRLLEMVSQTAARQRTAIIQRDARGLNRLFEALVQLQGEWAALMEERSARGDPEPGSSLTPLARKIREQLWLNRVLLSNGMAIVDHLMSSVSAAGTDSSQSGAPGGQAVDAAPAAALFSGVA